MFLILASEAYIPEGVCNFVLILVGFAKDLEVEILRLHREEV